MRALAVGICAALVGIAGAAAAQQEPWEHADYFAALRSRRVPSAMIRVPGATHIIAGRPSDLIAKVAHVLDWFGKHSAPVEGSRP